MTFCDTSHDTILLLSFLVLRNFSTTCNMGQPCCLSHCYLLLSILLTLNFLAWFLFPLCLSLMFVFFFYPFIISNFFLAFFSILGYTFYLIIQIVFLLWTFLEIFLSWIFLLPVLVLLYFLGPTDILSHILQLPLLHSPSSFFLFRYWIPL